VKLLKQQHPGILILAGVSQEFWPFIKSTTPTKRATPPEKSASVQGGRVAATFIKYNMRDFMEQCVERYLELAGKDTKLRNVETPFLDENKIDFDDPDNPDCQAKGVLAPVASSVLMKCLYAARMARYDILRAVTQLAKMVTKWNRQCDKMLHRLICYINSTLDLTLTGWIADTPDKLEIIMYTDADLGGDKKDGKSQSGIFIGVGGPNSFFPVSASSKKQTSTSLSTPEAEIVAARDGLKESLPMSDFWEPVFGREHMSTHLLEDNESAIQVLSTGKNPTMRHMNHEPSNR
jgi:hypothetical protein